MTENASVETAQIDRASIRRLGDDPPPPPVERLDRYELKRLLGRGGFATVYEAYDPRIKRLVAVKRCSSLDESNHARFLREAQIAGNLSHPNIVRIFDFGVSDGTPFIVQELLDGKDLADWIESGLHLSNYDRVRILHQIATGLAYAHSQEVIHRDIKPANIRVLCDGSIKLLDFGVAAIQEAPSNLTQEGMTVGTAAYLAPEQIRGEAPDRGTDIFAFGVLAYELLSGHRPFEGQTLSAILYQIAHDRPEALRPGLLPGPVVRLVHSCLEKSRENRPRSFDEIVEDLAEALRDPRLRPPAADTVPVDVLPSKQPVPAQPGPRRLGSRPSISPPSRPQVPLPEVALGGRSPAVRDSSTRIQAARADRGTRRALLFLLVLLATLGAVPLYSYLGGTLPKPASAALAGAENWFRDQLETWTYLVTPERTELAVRTPAAEPEPTPVPSPAESPLEVNANTVSETLDPVSAAIAVLAANRSSRDVSAKPETPVRTVSPNTPATLFLPPSWHPGITVAIDRGPFRPLQSRQTHDLKPGTHEITFRLETASYRASETVALDLEPAEIQTIESPLAPPAAVNFVIVPETTAGRVEIDGRFLSLPLREAAILEPGRHQIIFHPAPADPLGPLTKSAHLEPASVHQVTFDMRRRRATVEAVGPFEWSGE